MSVANQGLDAFAPLALLHRIAREPLPLIVTDGMDIESVSTLVHAGQIEATMQVVLPPWLGSPQPGLVVSRITRLGWMALAVPWPGLASAHADGQQEGSPVTCDSNAGRSAAGVGLMHARASHLVDKALMLAPEERSAVLLALLDSLEGEDQPAVDAALAEEIRRRKEQLRSGIADAAPWEEAKARLSAL